MNVFEKIEGSSPALPMLCLPSGFSKEVVGRVAKRSASRTMSESKVYIQGAGCSKDCGYPLGPDMKADLEQFGQSVDPATSPRRDKAVKDAAFRAPLARFLIHGRPPVEVRDFGS
jgi:hypothetical protein